MERRELIRRALELAKAGESRRTIANITGLSEQAARSVITYLQLQREFGPYIVTPDTRVAPEEIADVVEYLEGAVDLIDDETEKPIASKERSDPKYTAAERARIIELKKAFDADATAEECKADLQALQGRYPFRTIFRNLYRAEGRYAESTWTQFFGNMQEFRAQAGLEPTRYQRAHEKAIAKHASLDHYPEWYRKNIEPITMMYPRAERKRVNTLVSFSDNHGLKQDRFVYRVFKDVCEDMQPDVILWNGDQLDLYEFNRYGIDPRQADVVKELTYARDQLFRPIVEVCPNSEHIWNLGNHCWRLMKHMADASPYLRAVLADFVGLTWSDIFGVRELGINVNCKWDLKAFNQRDVEAQIRQNYIVFWDTFVAKHIIDANLSISGTSGHTHRPETRTSSNLSRGKRTPLNWTVTGSGCKGNAEYIEGLDRSSQGFGIFHIMPDSGIVVPENVIIQGDFAAVGGKYWYRRPDEK